MRTVVILISMGLAGCATSPPRVSVSQRPADAPAKPSLADRATALQSMRYELGSYRYPETESKKESVIVRVTRVPPHYANDSVAAAVSPSYEPLQRSTELAVELATQRDITERIRSVQSNVVAAEQKAKEQYGLLVSQSEAVTKLRAQLEADRERLREIEAQARTEASTAPATPDLSTPASTSTEGTKW